MKRIILAAGAAAGFAMAGMTPTAVAQTPAGEADYSTGSTPITLSAGAAHWYFASDRDLQNMSSPWVGLEWAFTDQWSTEISFTQDDANNENFPGTKTEVTLANLGMKYYGGSFIGDGGTLRPYAVLGAGFFSTDPKRAGGESNDDTTVNAGLGVRWMMTSRFGASLDARSVYNIDKGNADTIAYLGLNYYLGNVAPPPVIQTDAAAIDSDGDGVPDDRDACLGTPPNTRVDATGCPLPVAQVASIKLKVNFAFNSSVVQEQYFTDLGELAKFLKRFDEVDVSIDGYTDSVGPDDYNQKLSQRRAQAVVDMLVNTYGIDANRLKAVGYGESNPVASNDTAEGRAENRRVMASLEVEYSE
jgi:OOP family OmpA-OmpF porin